MKAKFKQNDVVKRKGDDNPMNLMDIISVVEDNNNFIYECSWFSFSPKMAILSDFFKEDDVEYVYSRDNKDFIKNFENSRLKKGDGSIS